MNAGRQIVKLTVADNLSGPMAEVTRSMLALLPDRMSHGELAARLCEARALARNNGSSSDETQTAIIESYLRSAP